MTTRKVPVDIELQGKLTLGMTVADFRAPAPADCHTSVAVDLDRTKFWNLVTDALVRIGEVDLGTPVNPSTTAAPASAAPVTTGMAAK
jgi:purine nucleosidase